MIARMSVLYPVAASAELALNAPKGRAAREREARGAAGEPVVFATDPTGPAFASREAALDAYAGRVEDERNGFTPAVEDRWCKLVEQLAPEAPRSPRSGSLKPVFRDGRRWPDPPPQAPPTVWRLCVSYWRVASAARPIEAPQARQARRSRSQVDPETLRVMARQPMRPVEPQQPLDIGLFERRLPENPSIVVPDE
jgi:hypothetical protein